MSVQKQMSYHLKVKGPIRDPSRLQRLVMVKQHSWWNRFRFSIHTAGLCCEIYCKFIRMDRWIPDEISIAKGKILKSKNWLISSFALRHMMNKITELEETAHLRLKLQFFFFLCYCGHFSQVALRWWIPDTAQDSDFLCIFPTQELYQKLQTMFSIYSSKQY